MSALLDQAQAALQAGQKPQAQALLSQVLKANPREEAAWVLLEQCVDQLERKKYCLQQALLINPLNVQARRRLADLESPAAPPPQPVPVAPPPPSPIPTTPTAEPKSVAAPAGAEDEFEPLEPDNPPAVTSLEAALMDTASYKPGRFVLSVNEPVAAEADDWQAELIDSATELEALEPESPPLAVEPGPDTPPQPPLLNKSAIRSTLEKGVALIEKGNKLEGVPLLEAVVATDPKNETAWLWLGAAAEDDQQKRDHFRRALGINPRNKLARDLLKPVEERLGVEATSEVVVAEPPPPTARSANRNGWIIGVFVALIVIVIAGFLIYWYLTGY